MRLEIFERELVGQPCIFGRHEISRHNRADGNGIIVCSSVSHNSHRAAVRQHGKILAGLAAGISYFLTDNRIRVTENVEFFSRQITDNANGKTRTREGLTVDKKIGQIGFLPTSLTSSLKDREGVRQCP